MSRPVTGPCELRLVGCTGVATTRDHIIPKSRGGTNLPDNKRPACQPCNQRKANRLDAELTVWDFAVADPRREDAQPAERPWSKVTRRERSRIMSRLAS